MRECGYFITKLGWGAGVDASFLLRADAVSVRRGSKSLLNTVSLSLRAGQIVTLVGPNGAGKTTLVQVLLGLIAADAGRVERREGLVIGYVPQRFAVPPSLPMDVDGFLRLAGKSRVAERRAVLLRLDVPDLQDAALRTLSGGELQRVLLARALLRSPQLLVLDEPAQGLDVHGQQELYRLIAQLRDESGCGVLMVSHDLHLVMAATDQVVCLEQHVCCVGTPEAISQHPEYLRLFGTDLRGFAVYQHHHDHVHDLHGNVVIAPASTSGSNIPLCDGKGGCNHA
ncbi:MAG: zinc ABC transporter ATP-binding protein ZnuC [Gammaproteobacteria bacterium 28-57-27]|nr:MAG: zinc ABC transporter ATP-binding protein ZnuC [Gammaproteobacteria bacterium 28-57-27]